MEPFTSIRITLQHYERKKESIWRNTTKYINMILETLTERFCALSEENDHGEDKSVTAVAGDSILHDVCWVLDSRKWIVPEGMAITLEAMDAVLEKHIESLSKIFYHFTQIVKKSHWLSQLRWLLTSISALLCMQWRIITTSSTHHWRCGNCWIHLKKNVDGAISS